MTELFMIWSNMMANDRKKK